MKTEYITDPEAVKSVYQASQDFLQNKAPSPYCYQCGRIVGYTRIPLVDDFQKKTLAAFVDCFSDGEHIYIAMTACGSCLGYYAGLDGFPLNPNLKAPESILKEYRVGHSRGAEKRRENEIKEMAQTIRIQEERKRQESDIRLQVRQKLSSTNRPESPPSYPYID